MSSWDYLSKFVIVGDSGVGKSSLLVRLTDQRFLADPDPTVGVEFGSFIVDIPETGERIKCQCWDTAGSETFRSITRSYYRGAAGALLVYNITHRASFLHITEWLRDVRDHAEENVSIILVGNMNDLCEDEDNQEPDASIDSVRSRARRRQVTKQEGEEFAQKEGLMFVEASAKTGQNVEEAFRRAARDIHAKFRENSHDRSKAGLSAGNSRPGVIAATTQGNAERSCCIIS